MKNFKRLIVWQKSMGVVNKVFLNEVLEIQKMVMGLQETVRAQADQTNHNSQLKTRNSKTHGQAKV